MISTATNTVTKTIKNIGAGAHDGPLTMAITPNGATLYTANVGPGRASVTAISTATDTVVRTISDCPGAGEGGGSGAPVIAVTPDSKTVYVICNKPPEDSGTVLPISTATNRPGQPIKISNGATDLAITPNSRTVYVLDYDTGMVTPVSTATNTAGKPILIKFPVQIAITPRGGA